MNSEIYAVCRWIIGEVAKKGADCRVRFTRRRFVELRYRERKPEIIREATTTDLDLNLYMNGKYTSQSTPDLRKPALEKFISTAIENTGLMEEDPYRSLPGKEWYENRPENDLKIYDDKHADLTPQTRHDIAGRIETACLEYGGDNLISVEAGFTDDEWEELVITGNGFEGTSRETIHRAGAMVTLQDEGDRRPMGYHWVGTRYLSDLPASEEIGKIAVLRANDLTGGKKLKTETLPVIIENRVVSNVLRGFLSGLYGSNIQQKRSFLSGKKGMQVGSRHFTLNDDPLIERGLGSRLYDSDGFPARAFSPVSEGKLEDFYFDWYYSRKLNEHPTTGGPSNLLIPPGDAPLSGLMKDAGRGILVTGFIGGNSNSATGDFSLGITGKLFENGEPVQSVAEMNIADNHLNFWKKLVAVGNDPWIYSSWRMPSLVFDNVVVAGV